MAGELWVACWIQEGPYIEFEGVEPPEGMAVSDSDAIGFLPVFADREAALRFVGGKEDQVFSIET